MAGYRIWLRCSIVVVVALVSARVSVGQEAEDVAPKKLLPATAALSCKVYSLADLGDDPKLCKWVAETIPEMIQPASWKHADAKLSFYGPSRILVINNTPAVHAQVEEFLQGLRKTTAVQRATSKHDDQVKPAQFALQDTSRPSGPIMGPAGYPVPQAAVGPRHLFHFIIRYEGDGIIDQNVAKFAKALATANAALSQSNYVFPPPPSPMDPLLAVKGTAVVPQVPMMPLADQSTLPPLQAPPPSNLPPPFPGSSKLD
jgi:hypothetical protein